MKYKLYIHNIMVDEFESLSVARTRAKFLSNNWDCIVCIKKGNYEIIETIHPLN